MYLRLFFALPSSEEDAILSIGKLVYGLRVKNGSSTPQTGLHTMPHDRRTHVGLPEMFGAHIEQEWSSRLRDIDPREDLTNNLVQQTLGGA